MFTPIAMYRGKTKAESIETKIHDVYFFNLLFSGKQHCTTVLLHTFQLFSFLNPIIF